MELPVYRMITLFIVVPAFLLAGCVSAGTYRKKMSLCKKAHDDLKFHMEKTGELRERNRELEKSLKKEAALREELEEELAECRGD